MATWLTIPSGDQETKVVATGSWSNHVAYPARFFRAGLQEREAESHCIGTIDPGDPANCRRSPDVVLLTVDLDALRSRVKVFYGGLAVVVVLVGLAFGAFRRRPT